MSHPIPFVRLPSGPDLRPEDIDAFEGRIGTSLPEQYRHFLLTCNGGVPSRPVCELAGESLYVQFVFQLDPKGVRGLDYELKASTLPQGWLPVALEGTGGRIVLCLTDGSVLHAPPEAWTTKRADALEASALLASDWDSFAGSCFRSGEQDVQEEDKEEEMLNRMVRNSDARELDKLLANGFDVNARNASGNTMVQLAALWKNYDFLEVLLARGASLSGALHTVAKVGSIPAAKWLVAHGASLEEKNADGQLPEEVCRMKFVANLLRNLRLGKPDA